MASDILVRSLLKFRKGVTFTARDLSDPDVADRALSLMCRVMYSTGSNVQLSAYIEYD